FLEMPYNRNSGIASGRSTLIIGRDAVPALGGALSNFGGSRAMLDYDKVPWRGVHEYLLEVESARNVQDFFARALAGIERLIPFDLASTLFDGAGRMLASKGF